LVFIIGKMFDNEVYLLVFQITSARTN